MKKIVGTALSLGWIILTNLLLFIWAGQYLDKKYALFPWMTLLGVLLAFVSIGITLYHIWKFLQKG